MTIVNLLVDCYCGLSPVNITSHNDIFKIVIPNAILDQQKDEYMYGVHKNTRLSFTGFLKFLFSFLALYFYYFVHFCQDVLIPVKICSAVALNQEANSEVKGLKFVQMMVAPPTLSAKP